MSIASCCHRALRAYQHDDWEDAFIQASIATAATAAREFQAAKLGDRGRYERFINHNVDLITKLSFDSALLGGMRLTYEHEDLTKFRETAHPLERLLYVIVRCCLVHEAGLPPGFQIVREARFATGKASNELIISGTLVIGMVGSVLAAPVNGGAVFDQSVEVTAPTGWRIRLAEWVGRRQELRTRLGLPL